MGAPTFSLRLARRYVGLAGSLAGAELFQSHYFFLIIKSTTIKIATTSHPQCRSVAETDSSVSIHRNRGFIAFAGNGGLMMRDSVVQSN